MINGLTDHDERGSGRSPVFVAEMKTHRAWRTVRPPLNPATYSVAPRACALSASSLSWWQVAAP